MIVNHTQSKMRILTRFDEETKLTEISFALEDAPTFTCTVELDYKEVDQLAHTLDRMSLAYNEVMDREVVVALSGMGIKPETSPSDPERRDLLHEAMEKTYGPRCRHPEEGCLACEAWRQYDHQTEAPKLVMILPPGPDDDVRNGD